MPGIPTTRQRDMLEAITHLTIVKGYPPTLSELAKHLGLSAKQSARNSLVLLKKKGLVEWDSYVMRSVRLKRSPDLRRAQLVEERSALQRRLLAVDEELRQCVEELKMLKPKKSIRK